MLGKPRQEPKVDVMEDRCLPSHILLSINLEVEDYGQWCNQMPKPVKFPIEKFAKIGNQEKTEVAQD
eukprot:3555440-Karenia_brevis.AAC.1